MFRLPKWLIFTFLFACPSLVHAQSCTTATCNATDCSRNSVLAALPASSNSNSTVVLNIPACPATGWTSNFNYSVPPAVASLTIQGQTTCTGSGDPAQNNLACTDGTIIQDNDITNNTSLIIIRGSGFIRLTGITLQAGSGITKNNGYLMMSASGNIRMDHNHFNGDTYTGSTPDSDFVSIVGCTNGVVDHNIFTNTNGENGFSIVNYNGSSCNGTANGDGVWAQPTGFGSSNALFIEQNLFQNNSNAGSRQANDCVLGGKGVYRFNTFHNGAHLQTHPTGSAGPQRGCRLTEIYGNTWIFNLSPTQDIVNTLFFYSSGTALVWGNKAGQGYASFVQLTDCRSPGPTSRCGYSPAAVPNGWGFCGSSSTWDGNTNGSGYPCIDQPGRGQGDLLTGQFPSKMDSAAGTITWPHQKLEPLYFWLNSYSPLWNGNGSPNPVVEDGKIWTQNVDYYVSSNQNSGTDCNGFTGATGIGCGPRSSRPSTCTAGVAWWSTDQGAWNQSGNGSGNGVLDICTSTNNWTNASYAPYTYPHPLTNNSTTLAPAAPTNLQVVVN